MKVKTSMLIRNKPSFLQSHNLITPMQQLPFWLEYKNKACLTHHSTHTAQDEVVIPQILSE